VTGSRRARPRVRVGFLGAGLIATYHSKSLRRSGIEADVDLVRIGVYDPDAERAAAFAAASGCDVLAGEDDVLDRCDAVYVCSWTSEHPRQVAAAAGRGIAVFCEKPLAADLPTAAAMTDTVRHAGVVNQVGLVLRRSPAFVVAGELVAAPEAGRVMAVVFRNDQFIPTQGHYASTWRADRDKAGSGTLLEHSIHDVDLLHALVGDVRRVVATEANFHGHDGIEDVVAATLEFANGARGTLTSVWHDNLARPSLRRVELFCERRHVVVDGDDWYGPVRWTDAGDDTDSERVLGGDDLVGRAAQVLDTWPNPDAAFVRAVAAGHPATPDFTTALRAHHVVEALYRSCVSGRFEDVGAGTGQV
jgi:predicted dehydrogenase